MLGDLLAALVIVLYGVAGGYAISGRGPVWGRGVVRRLSRRPRRLALGDLRARLRHPRPVAVGLSPAHGRATGAVAVISSVP
jgi:hypothetical protein